MMLDKTWSYAPQPTPDILEELANLFKTPPWMTALLWQRGIRTLPQAKKWFNPTLDQLHDPFAIHGMEQAVARLQRAIEAQEHIRLYGDYDVDGVTSVTLLAHALERLGARTSSYIPTRAGEGYGLSEKGIQNAIEAGVQLLLCVDCGTRAIAPLQKAQRHGIDAIVCDHHEAGEQLPPTIALLNPKQKACTYPFQGLSACGIAWKLLQALCQKYAHPLDPFDYLDLVALSIAADIVPMVDENRILMHHGLHKINTTPRPGIWALQQLRNQEKDFSVSDVVFGLAPPINAVGRMTHALPAVDLLLATTRQEATAHADTLHEQNRERKALDQTMTAEALAMAKDLIPADALVLHKPGWSKGIAGIVAARCVEHHHRPSVVLTSEPDNATLTGSGRSIPGVNLYDAIHACAPFLTKYGGHEQAVGLSLHIDQLAAFTKAFQAAIHTRLTPENRVPQQRIDTSLPLTDLNPRDITLLERMAPFGPDFMKPVFATQPVTVTHHHIYQDEHLKLFFVPHGSQRTWHAIGFGLAKKFQRLYPTHTQLAIAYQIIRSRYRGRDRLELVLKDIQPLPHRAQSTA